MAWWVDDGALSQVQLRIINNAVEQVEATSSGAKIWVQGCAGTGKTLVLTHIARRLQGDQKNHKMIFLTYTHALKKMIEETVNQAGVRAEVDTYMSFLHRNNKGNYDVIILDEVQDVKLGDLRGLKQRCTHLIVAGDCEQRIYESSNTESAIDEVISFDKSRLIELFRITRYIVKVAQKIMPWTKLTEGDSSKIKRDVSIAVRQFEDAEREAYWVYSEALAFARPGSPNAILLPNHKCIFSFCLNLSRALGISTTGPKIATEERRIIDYDTLNDYFEYHDLPLQYLGGPSGNLSQATNKPFVYILTYHSSKGLDFDHVFLPMLSSELEFGRSISTTGNLEYERTLFFVAITRSRERLVLSYTGDEPYLFIEEMPKEVVAFTKDEPIDLDKDSEFF